MDNLTKALALASIGVKVFPVLAKNRQPAIPKSEGGRGFYDATCDDFELIATWFSVDYVGSKYAVGAWMGGSGLVAADIDRGKSSGKDGFASLEERGGTLSETYSHPTPSGGEHHVYASDRTDLAPGTDVLIGGTPALGVDVRAAGSYIVWWGDDVPTSRDAFSTDIPEWLSSAATATLLPSGGEGAGFEGSVKDWLDHLPDDVLPSNRVRDFMARIPEGEFGHTEMVDLAWGIVRMGSERETGIRGALEKLRAAWLRDPFDTPKFRQDFYAALLGAINKAGRVQTPVPTMSTLSAGMKRATELGVADALKALERSVSGNSETEIDLARVRRDMFKIAAEGGVAPGYALGVVTGSKAFALSKASVESVWFGDGEPFYQDYEEPEEEAIEEENGLAELPHEIELVNLMKRLSEDAESYTFLSESEQATVATYEWFGTEYLSWVKTRLKHYNAPYHIGALWAALSVITSPLGKVPLQGYKATDVNLYLQILGESSSGKSEAWGFGKALIDAYYGLEGSPIVGDAKKVSALSLHRTLILRDGQPSLVYSDEVQGFYADLQKSHWQGSILADLSDYYGGDIPPKNTMNDKEISGKRAKGQLTVYFTGIADMSLDSLSLNNWRSGLLYRYVTMFGHPRAVGDYDITLETTAASYTTQMESWAREFKRVAAVQETRWGEGRLVEWEEDARKRLVEFNRQIDNAVKSSPLYDTVFIPANGRFLVSVMKCATIIALTEASEKVTLRHALLAISYAGPWHRSMVLAVGETGRDPFERDVERCLNWIKQNAIRQIGRDPWIQRSAVMRAFKPNEIAERLLRQLVEEGWLLRIGDAYQLIEE